jgi:ATP-dependent RNA helicase RhlE
MLDMGFAPDVKRVIAKLPSRRQSLLFSATMPREIREIADRLLNDPVHVEVTPVSSTVERIAQHVCHVPMANKHRMLVHLLGKHREGLVLVFSRTKHGANRLAERLGRDGIRAAAIHGNKSQGARTRALEEFRTGQTRVLVATDIAARGIDVKGISVVVNYDLPNEPEAYVHRIGRTARAGAEGLAFSLCDPSERAYLRDIQRLIRKSIPEYDDHPFTSGTASGPANDRAPQQPHYRDDRRQHAQHSRQHASAPAAQRTHHGARPHAPQTNAARPQGSRTPVAHRPGSSVGLAQAPAQPRSPGFFSLFRGRR